ncbi:amino acid ABC transporter permease [Rhizobium sp. AU243]|uniref:amino acid ABC transporter permease n=1 Tax=Rhizobium sp. AU243 TaxID=2303425 RepID=UPI0010CBDBBB|nr:amino acid ABC transporter permease [Rhizobium sp. AU243]TKV70768.1 amino acid ABC transporter permease [Rhizobium sp. AU243]
MAYEFQFGVIFENTNVLLQGIGLTVLLWAIAFAFSLVVGLFLGVARSSSNKFVNWPASLYIEVFRNTPVLVQLVWFYYAFPVLTGLQMSPFLAAVLGLSLNTSAYCSEIYRGGLQSVMRGQWEAGGALGMGYWKVLRRIILPQAFRRMIPAFTNRGVELAKMTSVASVISVNELMYEARLLSNQTFLPLETFAVVALIYFIIIYPGTLAAYRLERRLRVEGV